MARWILISDSNSQVSCKVKLPFSRELHHHHAPQPNSQIRPPHKIICVILTCKTAIFVADDRPGKCFITKFYNDNENMLQSYLLHLTVDSILLTSQEMSMTQEHLHLEYPCISALRKEKTKGKSLQLRPTGPELWDVKSTWSDVGAMWELIRLYWWHQTASVCCTLWGVVKIHMNGWWLS